MKQTLHFKSNLKQSKIFIASVILLLLATVGSFAQPLTANAGLAQSICTGSSATIGGSPTASYGSPPYTYSWAPAIGLSSTTTANPSAMPTVSTTYTVTITDAVSSTSNSTITVTVYPNPTVTANSTTICAGQTASLTAAGATTYSWNPSAGLSCSTCPNTTASPAVTTTYTVTGVSSFGCVGTANATVTVNALPVVNAGVDQVVCLGTPVNFSPSVSGATIYSWDFGDGGSATSLSPSYTYSTPGTYTASLSATSAGSCTTTDNITITVLSVPNVSITSTSVSCFGMCNGNATASVSGGSAPYVYSWSPGGMTTSGITNLCAGNYNVTVTDASGCSGVMTTTINQPPVINVTVSSNNVTCNGACDGTATSTVSGGLAPYVYNWSPGSYTTANVSGLCAGTYTLIVTDNYGCSMTSSPVAVTEPSALSVLAGADQTICAGDSTMIGAIASGGVSPYTYDWDDGGTHYSSPAVLIGPVTGTSYTLTVTDNNGCVNNDYLAVTVMPTTAILGYVTYSGGGLSTGTNTAVLYKSTTGALDTVQTTPVDAAGTYYFGAVPPGSYILAIFNDPTAYPLLTPTYYGNVYLWDSATVISHYCAGEDTADVVMVEAPAISGPGAVSGTVTEGAGFGRTPGDPIPGVDIKLGKNPGSQLVASGQTNSSGQYSFNNLPLNAPGESYVIYVDIPGLGRDSSYSVVIDASNTNYTGLNYEADSGTVYTAQSSVGIHPVSSKGNKLSVYPNPATETAVIEYAIEAETNVSLSIYSILGVKVAELSNGKQSAGKHKFNISAANYNLRSGVYFITLEGDGNTTIQRFVVTE